MGVDAARPFPDSPTRMSSPAPARPRHLAAAKCAAAWILVGQWACAPLLPPTGNVATRALVRDTMRVVDTQDQLGWTVDELEVPEVLGDTMQSACRVRPEDRREALAWLDASLAERGEDLGAEYVRSGRDLDAVETLWLLHRTRTVLRKAARWADDGKCPFYWEVDPDYSGLQGLAGQPVLVFEGGGRLFGQWEDGRGGFGGGGASRLLFGLGLDDRRTLLAGVEIGGAGRLTSLDLGQRLEVPELVFIASAPVQLRLHGLSEHLDLEAGPLAYINQLREDVQWGGRVGVGVGFSRLRVRGVLPTVTFAMNYDFIPPSGSLPEVHQVAAGFRAGVSLPL